MDDITSKNLSGFTQSSKENIATKSWSKDNFSKQIDLEYWDKYVRNCPKDAYIPKVYKRMSFVTLDDSGKVTELGPCPMAQARTYNLTNRGNITRVYPQVGDEMIQRSDFTKILKDWSDFWNMTPNEPIMVQFLGVKCDDPLLEEATVDPLQGQGIHCDGVKFVSIFCITRENIDGGVNSFYNDLQGSPHTKSTPEEQKGIILQPGECISFADDELFHHVTHVKAHDTNLPYCRMILILAARFVDKLQNAAMRQAYPDVVHFNPETGALFPVGELPGDTSADDADAASEDGVGGAAVEKLAI